MVPSHERIVASEIGYSQYGFMRTQSPYYGTTLPISKLTM